MRIGTKQTMALFIATMMRSSVTAFSPSITTTTTHRASVLASCSSTKAFFTSSSSTCTSVKKDSRVSFLFQKNNHVVSATNLQMTEDSNNDSTSSSTTTEQQQQQQEAFQEYKNKNNIDDQIMSAISKNGEIKVTAVTTRNLVNDAMINLSLTAVSIDALARSMNCGLLLSNGMQEEQTFQLTLNCEGPIRSVVAIANGKGEVKGYVGNPGLGQMPLPEAIGKGTVQVVKNHPDWPNPYNGITSIEHGDIDRDVGIYLAESEQRSCALAAATTVNGILCTSSGGYIVEQLPGCTPETVTKIEQNLAKLIKMDGTNALPTGLLMEGGTPLDICSTILDGLDMQPLQQMEPKIATDCCSADRLFRAVRLLPREDVDEIVRSQEQLEARCEFCGKVYRLSPEEVAEKFATAKGDPSLDADFEDGK